MKISFAILWVAFAATVSTLADTAILYALPAELAALKQELRMVGQPIKIAERQIHVGYRRGEKVVLAQSGSGQIAAAITAQAVLGRFKVDRLISIGPAGNLREDWKVGDIVVASEIVHYEAGSEKAAGFILKEPAKLRTEYVGQAEKLRRMAVEIAAELVLSPSKEMPLPQNELKAESRGLRASVHQGRIASGDKFIATSAKRAWLRETFKADAVDMMSAAIARVCEANGVPYVMIRALSDNADERATEDFAAFTRADSSAAAEIALKLLVAVAPEP